MGLLLALIFVWMTAGYPKQAAEKRSLKAEGRRQKGNVR